MQKTYSHNERNKTMDRRSKGIFWLDYPDHCFDFKYALAKKEENKQLNY
ncbi:hypothetical protein BH11BAC4_BH11BAC4_21610 [soil metagenome]